MSNPLKKVGKVFKKVAKAIKPIIKPLAIAAAIYFTGAALGAWGAGAGATGATAGATAGGAASGAGSGLGTLGALESGAAAGTAGGAAAGGAAAGTGSATSGLSLGATSGGETIKALGLSAKEAGAGLSLQAPSTAGTLKGAGKAILGFIEKNPATTMIAGQALSSAFTPTAAEEQLKLEQARRRRSTFYGTGLGGQGPGINTGALSSVMSGFNQNQYNPAPQIAGTQYAQPMQQGTVQQGAMAQQPQVGVPGGALSQYAGQRPAGMM